MEVLGPKDFVIHHRSTFNNSNLAAMTWFPVRPAHYWEGRDPNKPTLIPPVASGPYRVADFDRSYVTYRRVDDYWGRDIPINRGRYNFDEIRYEVYRDQSVAREAFRKGLFDIMFETDIRHWVSSYDIPAVTTNQLRRSTREVRKFIGAERAIALNTRRSFLSDVRVREALTIVFDFEWQNRVMRHGTQSRALSYFANSQFAAKGRSVAAVHRLQGLVGFLQQEGLEGIEGLLAVPGTTAGTPQPIHQGYQLQEFPSLHGHSG
jgi:microcin C transport system substrate-binding protein